MVLVVLESKSIRNGCAVTEIETNGNRLWAGRQMTCISQYFDGGGAIGRYHEVCGNEYGAGCSDKVISGDHSIQTSDGKWYIRRIRGEPWNLKGIYVDWI